MANGLCRVHGGLSLSGRANPAFRTGKFTKQAIEERAMAKLMRKEAEAEYLHAVRPFARYGVRNSLDVKEARQRLEEKLAEALRLEFAWVDRHWPRDAAGRLLYAPTRRRYRPRRRRESPEGYNCANLMNRGRFTKQAEAQRAAEREALAAAMARAAANIVAMPRKRKPMDPERARLFAARGREAQRRKRLVAIDEAAERKREAAERAAEWCTWNARKHPKTPE
jgi:hypothetical protein